MYLQVYCVKLRLEGISDVISFAFALALRKYIYGHSIKCFDLIIWKFPIQKQNYYSDRATPVLANVVGVTLYKEY